MANTHMETVISSEPVKTELTCQECDKLRTYTNKHQIKQTTHMASKQALEWDGDNNPGMKKSPAAATFLGVRAKVHQSEPGRVRKKKKNKNKIASDDTASQDKENIELPNNSFSSTSRTDNMIAVVKKMGDYSDQQMCAAMKRIEDSDEELSYPSLIDMAFTVQQEDLEEEVKASFSGQSLAAVENDVATDKQKSLVSQDVVMYNDIDENIINDDEDDDQDDEEKDFFNKKMYQRAVDRRKSELVDAIEGMTFRCRVCNTSTANILLLPCAHLVSCEDCLMDVRRCPIPRCNKIVRGTKEVYLV